MIKIRLASSSDLAWLRERDSHIEPGELASIIRRGRILLAENDNRITGWLRWGMFWDEIPFMNMLFVDSAERNRGIGGHLVQHWEEAMHHDGHTHVLTSTLANESAQYFYRHIGYLDCGGLLLPDEPIEILLRKGLPTSPRHP